MVSVRSGNTYRRTRITAGWPTLPDEVESYLEALVERLREALGDRLVAVWLIGSAAMGAFRPGESDLDVAVVVTRAAGRTSTLDDLPVPATKLEIVFYDRELKVVLDPNPGSGDHWYLIDLAIAREHGRALLGPPPSELIGEIPRERDPGRAGRLGPLARRARARQPERRARPRLPRDRPLGP